MGEYRVEKITGPQCGRWVSRVSLVGARGPQRSVETTPNRPPAWVMRIVGAGPQIRYTSIVV